MHNSTRLLLLTIALTLPCSHARAAEPPSEGHVKLPLKTYTELLQQARADKPQGAPAGYALGNAKVTVTATETAGRVVAEVQTELSVQVLEDQWVLVPLLPAGTAVSSATVSGRAVDLVAGPGSLAWITKREGSHRLVLKYQASSMPSATGVTLSVPLPQAAALTLTATLPGPDLDATVIPSSGAQSSARGNNTRITAIIPTTSGVQIAWRRPTEQHHAISKATYRGKLAGDAISWNADFEVTLFQNDTVTLELLPRSITLAALRVDGKEAPIIADSAQHFATLVRGKGRHRVSTSFEVPVVRGSGPPHVQMDLPEIPVSRFDLTLPGRREATVTPAANVSRQIRGNTTSVTFFVPMTEELRISWSEAVPEAAKTEVRANAMLVHAVHAQEGVLYVRAMVEYDVNRGETNVLQLAVPSDVQVNRVTAAQGGVADWRIRKQGGRSVLSVFLDRRLKGTFSFDVEYDRSLARGQSEKVPLLEALDVHRQRGMVALLASKELTLKPMTEEGATRVGENQLPAAARQAIDKTVAHTYKYAETLPQLQVTPTAEKPKQGKFDAQVNTLISLGDVTMKGAATVEVNVKSGAITNVVLELPAKVNFLGLSAPSLRTHKLQAKDDKQLVDVQFTQPMEGSFRLEASYERITADAEAKLAVPTLSVRGAEVEQGRIAVEALSAVEVQPANVKQLSTLDPSELPQQLIMKTTNPILLAYKYVHVDPPYQLALKVTRHKEISVQGATIDHAQYRTLFTKDGLAVTTAHFTVRNSRKQFLKVTLPADSKVWAAFVSGEAVKPALADDKKKASRPQVLLKIINSAQGFPVTLIYATKVSKISGVGTVTMALPRPDMVATRSSWQVYLPEELTYGRPDTEMKVLQSSTLVTGAQIQASLDALNKAGGKERSAVAPLQLTVPSSGVLFAFEKLYANQTEDEAEFSIPYASSRGALAAHALAALGLALLLLGLGLAWQRTRSAAPSGEQPTRPPEIEDPLDDDNYSGPSPKLAKAALAPAAAILLGVALLWLTLVYWGISPAFLLTLVTLLLASLAALWGYRQWQRKRTTHPQSLEIATGPEATPPDASPADAPPQDENSETPPKDPQTPDSD